MAEILALGISHYPPLLWPDKNMSGLLKAMMRNPNLPESLKTPAGWSEAMRKEWGDDEGEAAAAVHREQMVDWTRKARQALDDFNPDFVLLWGDDQYENFREDIVPPYCVNAHPEFRFHNFPNNIWGEPVEKEFVLPGVAEAGKYLASELISAGFDSRCTIRSATPSRMRFSTWIMTARASTIRSCRFRSIATAGTSSARREACHPSKSN